jgi:hypothetical protein
LRLFGSHHLTLHTKPYHCFTRFRNQH